jgi:mono/diheme cytochrome c family protein
MRPTTAAFRFPSLRIALSAFSVAIAIASSAFTARSQNAIPLVWDAMSKETWPKAGEPVAQFKFTVTNTSDYPFTISNVTTSCGCTVAKIPSQPWPLEPHASGDMTIAVNLAGKSGQVSKTITVHTGVGQQILVVTMHMPDSPEAVRARNMQLASIDRQEVFKGDCAKCHADPSEGKMGADLYVASCGVCHDAKVRATMVPDLKHLAHATDYDFWKMTVTIGKPGTLMPAFGSVAGGPLTDAQIDSLARFLADTYPSPVINSSVNKPGVGAVTQ